MPVAGYYYISTNVFITSSTSDSVTYGSDGTWNVTWSAAGGGGGNGWVMWDDPPIQRTDAEIQAEYDRRNAERREASAKAEALLLSILPEDQHDSYRRHTRFEVVGSHGGRYRISDGCVGNVAWFNDAGEIGGTLCAHPTMHEHWLPQADVMLAQMLALTTDEREFVQLANVQTGIRPQIPRRRRTMQVA